MNKCPIPKEREEVRRLGILCSGLEDCEECGTCDVKAGGVNE